MYHCRMYVEHKQETVENVDQNDLIYKETFTGMFHPNASCHPEQAGH